MSSLGQAEAFHVRSALPAVFIFWPRLRTVSPTPVPLLGPKRRGAQCFFDSSSRRIASSTSGLGPRGMSFCSSPRMRRLYIMIVEPTRNGVAMMIVRILRSGGGIRSELATRTAGLGVPATVGAELGHLLCLIAMEDCWRVVATFERRPTAKWCGGHLLSRSSTHQRRCPSHTPQQRPPACRPVKAYVLPLPLIYRATDASFLARAQATASKKRAATHESDEDESGGDGTDYENEDAPAKGKKKAAAKGKGKKRAATAGSDEDEQEDDAPVAKGKKKGGKAAAMNEDVSASLESIAESGADPGARDNSCGRSS